MDIQKAWEAAYRGNAPCNVKVLTYRGTGHAVRTDKAIHILSTKDFVALAGDRGTRGPALLKSNDNLEALKGYKSTAFFNLKNAGYDKANTTTNETTITNAVDLWEAVFRQHHSTSLDAKIVFLKLVGEVDDLPVGIRTAPETPEIEKPANPYLGNKLYGLI